MSGLNGVRVLVLRPEHQAGQLADVLAERGAEPIVTPAITILPPADWSQTDAAVGRLCEFDWAVFTSVNGVGMFLDRARHLGTPISNFPPKIGAIGPGTAAALGRRGLQPDWKPTSYTSAAISEELPDPPAKVLLVRADIATGELDLKLIERGFEVTRVDAYRTEAADPGPIMAGYKRCDAVALTSASIARSFAAAVAGSDTKAAVCSIGPATSEQCRRSGIEVTVEADEHTIKGLVAALAGHYGQEPDSGDE